MTHWLGGIGEAFADRNFRLYSIGSILSWITYFIQQIAFSWAVWQITHSTAWLATVALLEIATNVVFLPLGGVLADRVDRFAMALTAYAFDFLKALALAILAFTDQLTLPIVCACAVLHGLIHAFSVPASFGMMPRFVTRERLSAAIAVAAAYTQFAIFAGPAIASWVLVRWGLAAAFAVNVAGYLIFFVTAALLRTPQDYRQSKSASRSFFKDIPDGARYIFGHRGIAALLLIMLVGDALLTATYQLMPAYSDLLLGAGVGGMSILVGAAGLGATLAALWLAHGGSARATPQRVLSGFVGFALAVGLLAVSPSLFLAVPAMLLFGFAGESARTATTSILQTSVDDAQRGRVMSTRFLFQRAAGGLGTVAIGAAAEYGGLRTPLLVAAALALAVGLTALSNRARLAASFSAVAAARAE